MHLLHYFYDYEVKLSKVPLLNAIRKGLIYLIPLLLLGSFSLLLTSLPIEPYQTFLNYLFGENWQFFLQYIYNATFGMLSPIIVISISYSYISELEYQIEISPIIGALVSLTCFILISNIDATDFSLTALGVSNIFPAIIIASSSSYFFVKLSVLRAFHLRAFTQGANATFRFALSSLFPATITIVIFAIINRIIIEFYGISHLQQYYADLIESIFAKIDSPLLAGLLFIGLIHLFWFFGIHGNNIMDSVAQTHFQPGTIANYQAILDGMHPSFIFTKTTFDCFVFMGGSGTTVCLVLAILLFSKLKNLKGLCKLSLLPTVFNINELLLFGLPIVLNPIFLVPFLVLPILLSSITYFAIYFGLVPYLIHSVTWTTPIFLSGYIATESLRGSMLQLFNLIVGTLCYLPFVKLSERSFEAQCKSHLHSAFQASQASERKRFSIPLLSRHDEVGNTAKLLALDLKNALTQKDLFLEYQPQVDYDGNTFGIEALLRWRHHTFGMIPPPLIVDLAEETSLMDRLGIWIIEQAVKDSQKIHQHGFSHILISINISALQLENKFFAKWVKKILDNHKTPYQSVQFEITEQTALARSDVIIEQIEAIRKLGIKIVMDDFGMGHSSLKHLINHDFDSIKIDGSIIKNIVTNENSQAVVKSLVQLNKSLKGPIIAEYIESAEQKETLYELGCTHYQGYLFSKPLTIENLITYLHQ